MGQDKPAGNQRNLSSDLPFGSPAGLQPVRDGNRKTVFMTEIGVVREVSGEWRPAQGVACLRIKSDRGAQSHDLLIEPSDIQSLVTLLLALASEVGPVSEPSPANAFKSILPLQVDSLGLGEANDDDHIILEMEIGAASLAFALPSRVCIKLGQSLLTLAAERDERAN